MLADGLIAPQIKKLEQLVADLGLLDDPTAVHINLLRGSIAKPSIESIIHLYGRDALVEALGLKK